MTAPPRQAAVVLGTRASALARTQTDAVAALLAAVRPGLRCETKVISTAGDRTQASGLPLPEIGGKGLFTAELERALREGVIDIAVHSLKDLPTEDAENVVVGAVSAREDVRDCLVAHDGGTLAELPDGAVVGTSSLRRGAQLRALRPDLDVRSIRGNVDTRIAKVRAGEYDATVLAAAGIRRLGLEHEVAEWLEEETMLPAPGQGALAVQCRADDHVTLELLREVDEPEARAETTAERAFLATLGAGCAAPVAARAVTTATPRVRLQGLVASVDGGDMVRVEGEGDCAAIGEKLALDALARGADRILAAIRG
ncbi:MAG TPA: hydroxymethylbilane synthase [Gaiellaceae bacterium]|nr:hydroxymethylbilane synthase [Gaiellaceae bacterium]